MVFDDFVYSANIQCVTNFPLGKKGCGGRNGLDGTASMKLKLFVDEPEGHKANGNGYRVINESGTPFYGNF